MVDRSPFLIFFLNVFLFEQFLGIFNLIDKKSRLCFSAPWAERSPYRLEAVAVLQQNRDTPGGGKSETGHSTDHASEHTHPPCPPVPQGTPRQRGACASLFPRGDRVEGLRLIGLCLEAEWEPRTPSTLWLHLQKPEG